MRGFGRVFAASVTIALVVGGLEAPAGAAVLCQKKSGVVVVRDTSCKKKEAPLDLTQFGAVGPKGDKGDKGDQGDPGAPLIAHTQNVETTFPISNVPTIVAAAGDLTGAVYSGSYSAALVQPAGTMYMVLNVQAHVANVTGTGVACTLQSRANSGAWTQIAQTPVAGTEAFLNASFPSFVAGTSWAFRVVCATTVGSGTARGEIGVVAGILS